MTFTFPCDDCGKGYEVEDKHVGRRFRCECGATCTVIAPKGKASGALKETAAADERPRKKSVTASDASEDKQTKSQTSKATPPRKKAPVKKAAAEDEFDDVEVFAPSSKKRRVQEAEEFEDIEDYDDYEVLDDDDDEYESYTRKRSSGSRSKAKGKKAGSRFSFGKVVAYIWAGLSVRFNIWIFPFLIGFAPFIAAYLLWNNNSPGDQWLLFMVLRATSVVGFIAIAIGGLSGVIGASKEDPICGLLWVLVPFYSLYYLASRFNEQKFAVGCIGWGLLTLACQALGWQLFKSVFKGVMI